MLLSYNDLWFLITSQRDAKSKDLYLIHNTYYAYTINNLNISRYILFIHTVLIFITWSFWRSESEIFWRQLIIIFPLKKTKKTKTIFSSPRHIRHYGIYILYLPTHVPRLSRSGPNLFHTAHNIIPEKYLLFSQTNNIDPSSPIIYYFINKIH